MAFVPLFMKNVDLTIGDEVTGVNFKCQVRSVVLKPDTQIQRVKTLCPTGQYSNVEDPEWTLDVGYLYGDDTASPTGVLADYLLTHKGELQSFLLRPQSGGRGYSGTVRLVPGAIGGEQGSFSEQSVSLPVEGQPVPVAAL